MSKTDITVVLDRSGSMHTIADDTIGGFNKFVDGQRDQPGEATMTLVQFDNEYLTTFSGMDIKSVPPLTAKTFQPRGGTALLDAIGLAVESAAQRMSTMQERPDNVIIAVITDGQENASKRYSWDTVKKLVDKYTEEGWTFVFLGANMDVVAASSSLGIANAASYSSNTVGTAAVYAAMNKGIGAIRSAKVGSDMMKSARSDFFNGKKSL